jgi:serine/threonine protein kinase
MPDSSPVRKLQITLLQERAAGTFARVYLARARAPDGLTRIVAVKVLREKWANTAEVLTRTRDEAQLLARLQHPHILRVEAITEVEGQTAIVMEFVHGADLGQILDHLKARNAHFPCRTVFEIAELIMGALAAAYFKVPIGMAEPLRVVHRDIKPSNIMISSEGALKVLDFGTARFDAVERAARTEAIRFGSLKYMSSERREGDRGDHSSDVYSLGLMLLEFLHGDTLPTLPIERADHDLEIQRRIGQVEDLGLPNDGWDASLRQTLGRMLAYDSHQRLDAQQCVKLFRAFKEQAAGDSLAAFAENVVSPMVGNVFAAPDDGKMTGAKFELEAPPSGFSPLEPDPPTETATPAESAKIMLGNLETKAMARAPAAQQQAPVVVAKPGFAFGNLSVDDVEALPAHDGPNPFKEGTGPIDVSGGGHRLETAETVDCEAFVQTPAPPAAPPTDPAEVTKRLDAKKDRSRWIYGALGCAFVSLLLGIGGAVAYSLIGPARQAIQAREAEANPDALIYAGLAGHVTVSISAGDPTVQWVRLMDGEGNTLITARPDGAAQIPEGNYTLRVKVVARPTLSKEISIKEETMLSCKPATMGRVKCTDGSGSRTILLKP